MAKIGDPEISTNRRLAFIGKHESRKLKVASAQPGWIGLMLSSKQIALKGSAAYTGEDLEQDLKRPKNLSIPLEEIDRVEAERLEEARRFGFVLIVQTLTQNSFGPAPTLRQRPSQGPNQ